MNRPKRLVLPVWKLWLMNQPFRVLQASANGFGPGFRNLLRALRKSIELRLIDPDRLRWRSAQILNLKRRK